MADTKNVMLDIILILLLIVKIIWILALFSQFINKKYYNNSDEKIIIKIQKQSFLSNFDEFESIKKTF